VQPKNRLFPTGARLLNRAREILVRLTKRYKTVPLPCQLGRVRDDQAPALCSRKTVQARSNRALKAQDLSRAHHATQAANSGNDLGGIVLEPDAGAAFGPISPW